MVFCGDGGWGPPLSKKKVGSFHWGIQRSLCPEGPEEILSVLRQTGVADDALQGTQWATKLQDLQAIRSHADSLEIAAGIFFCTVTQASVRNWHKLLEFQSFRWDDDL